MNSLLKESSIWQWTLFSFALAGLGGFLFRFGLISALPYELNLENIRHAHSHLMFFGWAALLPLYLIYLDTVSGYQKEFGSRLMMKSLWFSLSTGLLSFPSFILWGYKPVELGDALIPVSAIISGFVMLGWYGFMIGYLITRKKKHDFVSNVWFEGALLILFISSLGAWGVGGVGVLDIGGPLLAKALTHFFLATFTEGWVILVLLGFISKSLKMKPNEFVLSPMVLVGLVSFGAPLTFPYGISESLMTSYLFVSARVGGCLVAIGILLFVYSAVKSRKKTMSFWVWVLLFLVIKAVMQLSASLTPVELWISDHGARILYLHVVLLGAFTTAMVIVLLSDNNYVPKKYFYSVLISIISVLLSLILLTSLWPSFLSGLWIYHALATAAFLPVVTVFVLWMKLRSLDIGKLKQ